MKKIMILLIGFSISFSHLASAKIRSEVINYEIAGEPFQGYLSFDDEIMGERPGVLVVHEWWGHNAYARKRADMLAEMGYTAFALDMYGKGKLADHPKDAQKFMQEALSNIKIAEARFNAAKKILKLHPTVSSNKLAAIGYCFGGGVVIHMARIGTDLSGVVSFHGALSTKSHARKGNVKAKIVVFNGAADPFVTSEQISALKQEMKEAGAALKFINYPSVKHSFTNPAADEVAKRFKIPLAYNEKADNDSWQQMQTFFKQIFNKY